MKKNKILTSLMAFIFVLSLGACNETEAKSSDGENESEGSITLEPTNPTETTTPDGQSDSYGDNNGDENLAHSPSDILEQIYNENNYHVTIYYDAYETAEDYKVTYGDYLSNSTYYWQYLQTYISAEYYAYDIYYMENAILAEEYVYSGSDNTYLATGAEIIYYDYGTGSNVYRWISSDGYYYSGSYYPSQYRLYDVVYSLMLAYSSYNVQSGFTYVNSGKDYYGDAYDLYNLDATSAYYLFVCLGTEFLFGSQSSAISMASVFDFDGAYFYEESQTIEFDYWTYGLYTDDETATNDSIVYFGEYVIQAIVTDIGTTTDNGYCEYTCNYFLSLL